MSITDTKQHWDPVMEEQDPTSPQQLPTPDYAPSHVSHPLRGVVICCTAIPPEKRTQLASQAEQMGAQHKFDLTSEVTHLVVGAYDTPKYRYVAKERPDIKVLTPEWVEAVCQLWIEDQAIDVDAMERKYTLPTFASLRICVTGFEDQEERQKIIDLVHAQGGDYHGDLTKKVTHLIAHRPEGEKYKHAKAWGLHLVSVEWFRDSLERGMILEEKLYNPEWPVEERGKDAWVRPRKLPLGKRSRDASMASLDEGKRKLRRTASTKLTSQNEKIWGDIVGGSHTTQPTNTGEWGAMTIEVSEQQVAIAVAEGQTSSELNNLHCKPATTISQGTFSACRFYIHGFDRKRMQVLQRHLTSHEAEISATLKDLVIEPPTRLYMVVPHTMHASETPDVTQIGIPVQTVTDWWVERCLGAKRLIDPVEYILGCPFPIFPLQQFSELAVCSTGFESMQLLHISKAVALMGAKYEEILSKDASVLICNSAQNLRREKLVFAHEWKIPVVSLGWLLDSIQSGEKLPFKPYLQRLKKTKTEAETTSSVEKKMKTEDATASRVDKALEDKKRPSTEEINTEVMLRSSKEVPQPAKASRLDNTAFQDDGLVRIKREDPQINEASKTTAEPLVEISRNSTRKAPLSPSKVSISIAPKAAPPAIPQDAINTAINSLLAKSKTAITQTHEASGQTDILEGARRKRAPSRILGRVASNGSAAASERASSVDSTASSGHPVMWPSHSSKGLSGERRNSSSLRADKQDATSIAMRFQGGNSMANGGADGDDNQPPPQTQMQYEDPESSEYKARVLARITGKKVERKEKERVATVASLDAGEPQRLRKGRALRERHSGGASMMR